MNLTLSTEQTDLTHALQTLFGRYAGAARARELADDVDVALLTRLAEEGFLDIAGADGAGLVDAVLLVEAAERAYARAPVAARAIVAASVQCDAGLSVGLVAGPRALVRYAGQCDTYLFLDGVPDQPEAFVASAADVEVEPVPSRWGYPLGRVRAVRRESLGDGRRLRSAWQIALAAEMGAQMSRAIELTARYVTDRHQFGRPIGSYQAVSHRLAQAAVAAEGTTWMARRAAWNLDDATMAAAAATYACEAGRIAIEGTHQVTGAIGITHEYDLVLSTMRLGVLVTELGGAAAHARAVVQTRWFS
jgi:hypothetical protein